MNRPNLLIIAATVIFFTSSFDIFLNFNLGPNLRAAQLAGLALLIFALMTHRMGMAFSVPLGSTCLIAWCAVQLAFVPVAEFWQKSLAYWLWLVLNVAISFAMVNLFAADMRKLQLLLKLYLASYAFVAAFGMVQFALPLFGGPALLVEQWWITGRVPRINGFSYEPSYFATYLIMGQACLGSLRRSGTGEYRSRAWTLVYLLLIVALVVCFSRIGVAFTAIELSIAPLRRFWRVIRNPRNLLRLRLSGWKITAAAVLVLGVYFLVGKAIDWFNEDPETIRVLVSGTGLLGTASHSVDEREDHLHDTLQVIAHHPWMGQSLGGVTESIAAYHGLKPQNFLESKQYEGQSVFAEVVAASGIPGSIPFFCFLIVTIAAPLRLARRSSPQHAAWLRALVLALVFEWATLQFNQNILRVYLWVHIALLATVYEAFRRQYTEYGDEAAGYASPNLLA